MDVKFLNVETEDSFVSALELAANNDLEGFKKYVDHDSSGVDEVGRWYCRKRGSNRVVLQHMTPLMVAATYGSVDVLKLIVSLPEVDVNRTCGVEKITALHCAATSGSVNAVDIVKLLLAAGADRTLVDGNGQRPFDVIVVSPKLEDIKCSLQVVLAMDGLIEEENGVKVSKCSDVVASPVMDKREYPIDPSFPDIKNSMYSSDEFRMFSFKILPCSRAYSHDWTECPFVHPGENARRRDPRKYHYSCVPCPDFRKGACRRGDMCEYAHGVFECWLHPTQYRTRLCKDGTSCNRRVCFFAHVQEELRPVYVSTGSAVPSPRSANAIDFAAAMNILPGSPSSVPVMTPSPFNQPMSPSGNGRLNMGWPSQSSRLRSSLNARDMPPEFLNILGDIDVQQHLRNELPFLAQPFINTNLWNRPVHPKTLSSSSLEDIFSAEGTSPRYSDQALASAVFSTTHKSAVFNQFQQQHQNMVSPIKTTFSPMSPHAVEPVSPMSARMSMLARHEKQHKQFRSLSSRNLGCNTLASSEETWSKWGTPEGPPEWDAGPNDPFKLKRSLSSEHLRNVDEPDLSWVHSLVKESAHVMKEKSMPRVSGESTSDGVNVNNQVEQFDQSVLSAWLEQMQLDQLVAQ